jgi:hypothetical protein
MDLWNMRQYRFPKAAIGWLKIPTGKSNGLVRSIQDSDALTVHPCKFGYRRTRLRIPFDPLISDASMGADGEE